MKINKKIDKLFKINIKFIYAIIRIQKQTRLWLNWIEHWVSAPAVVGSNPTRRTTLKARFNHLTECLGRAFFILHKLSLLSQLLKRCTSNMNFQYLFLHP